MLPCSGDLVAGWSSRMPQLRAHTKIFRDLLAGKCPSREKYLEYFSKFRFLMFLATQSGKLFTGGRSSCEGYKEIFAAYLVTFSLVELLFKKSTQKIFQKFWFQRVSRLTLATCTQLNSVAEIVCFAQFGHFFKHLGFPSNILCLFIVFPDRTSLKPTVFLT